MHVLKVNSRASRVVFPGVVINSFEIRSMPVDDLWPPVKTVPVFVDEVKDSIDEQGLINPIIVVRAPREDMVDYFVRAKKAIKSPDLDPEESLPYNMPDTPVINAIWGGSNRLDAIKQLGYTHVDCVIIPDFHTAMKVQDIQRDSYKEIKEESQGGSAG